MKLIATEYQFESEFNDLHQIVPVRFVRMNSPFYEGEKWCVREFVDCLNKDGKWEYEPMPSSRDDEFYASCRFDSFKEAYEFVLKLKLKG